MEKPNGLGWKIILIGLFSAFLVSVLADWIHLSALSQQIILIFTVGMSMVMGGMIIYQNRTVRRTPDSAWHVNENFKRY